MSSTRNKNAIGDYQLEQLQNQGIQEYSQVYGEPSKSHYAGNGLLMGRMASIALSYNACDIESQLYGIGSTNLVKPKEDVHLDAKKLQSLNVMNRLPTFIPSPLKVEPDQRYPFE
jgi:hypothetical protein